MNQPPDPPPGGPPGGWGLMQAPGTAPPEERQLEPFAAVSLAVGLCGLVTSWCCGLFVVAFGLAGVVIGIISLQRIAAEPARFRGKSLAIAGIVVSALGPVLMLVLVFVFSLVPGIFGPAGR